LGEASFWARILTRRGAILLALSLASPGCAHFGNGGGGPLPPGTALTPQEREDAIRRAEVWSPINIHSLDLKAGLDTKEAFDSNERVECDYVEKKLGGRSPKFACTDKGKELRVKYGLGNAELYGSVLSTRLFWALGFGAMRINPVRVRCHGCPQDPWKSPEKTKTEDVRDFDPATVMEWAHGRAMETAKDSGWKWSELEMIGAEAGPQARAHRDALKLLATFVQHTDSKPQQQLILCPKGEEVGKTGCRHPFLMVSDLGLTFGSAGLRIRNDHSVNLARWSETPVWKDRDQCVAQLGRSFTSTLRNPHISEAGRAFLAGLLVQLSDAQLRDLFKTGRVQLRSRDPTKGLPPAGVDEWVAVFKRKRDDVVNQRCPQ
jgi:hypothetical protein